MLKELVKNEIQKLTWNIEDLEKEIQRTFIRKTEQ